MYALCGTWGLTVEETGRRARYEFLQRTAEAIGAEKIATAHHQNDLAETVLLQLLRGTGPQGLTGIPPVRGNIVRPLLDTPRRDIERYIAEHDLAYVTDETNGDTAYARNRLRLEIWPELEGINPRAAEHIACTADILRRENAYLDALAAERLRSTGTGVDCEALLAAPEALRPRMLRLLLDRLPTGRKDLGAVHLAALEQLAAGEGALSLPEGVEAVCRGGVLTLCMAETAPEETVLRRGENPYGAGIPRGEQKPHGGSAGTAVRRGAAPDGPLLAAGGPADTAGRPRGAESEAAHGGAGRETREPPENTGAVCGRRGRRRVGHRRGQELPAGAIRRGHILYYNERKLTEDKTVWRRAIWIRIF